MTIAAHSHRTREDRPARDRTIVTASRIALIYAHVMAVSRSRRAKAARRRKRRMNRVEHDLTGDQWAALRSAWGGCAYCGSDASDMQRDCVQALSRGGRYTLDNIVPACRSCNASKCNDEVTGWLRRKRLDERTFLLRHLEIRTTLEAQFGSAPAVEDNLNASG